LADSKWSAGDIQDFSGKRAVVTGANSGIGYQVAIELARHGAHVTLGCRNESRAQQAMEQIRTEAPDADVAFQQLDLADLNSVRRFAESYGEVQSGLDVLVNNAGVMGVRHQFTPEGFEWQFGVNYLGHFALTGRLMPLLQACSSTAHGRNGARVVTVASLAHWMGHIPFDDLHGERRYQKWDAYNQSKLACLLFSVELARRTRASGLTSVAAHPGVAKSDVYYVGPRMDGAKVREAFSHVMVGLLARPSADGALPVLYAATAADVAPGACYGPTGPGQIRGRTGRVKVPRLADDRELAGRLWQVSEELTGVSYDLKAAEE
jgi:NAD(P)-dependent dehydrogenase (short-subunit alcohol dehydrogenase family)